MSTITPISAPDASGQRGFYNKYPYTDFHELNLDWLLTNYQAIIDKTNNIISWVNTHQIEYEEAIARLTAVENEIDTFEATVNARFEALKAQIEADFEQQKADLARALAETKAEIDAEMLRLTNEVNAAISNFEYRFTVLRNELINEINQLKADVNRQVIQVYNVMEANNEYVFDYVENRLQEFIDSFPSEITVYVYNPYRGEVTDIQTAILDIYNVACIWGLTALQYDSLELTAQEYDDLELTAVEYDTLGYKLLYKDPMNYMISPFSGEYVPIKEVVYDLAALHSGEKALSASAYDALDLSAEDYDNYELTAFAYDWYASDYLTA